MQKEELDLDYEKKKRKKKEKKMSVWKGHSPFPQESMVRLKINLNIYFIIIMKLIEELIKLQYIILLKTAIEQRRTMKMQTGARCIQVVHDSF